MYKKFISTESQERGYFWKVAWDNFTILGKFFLTLDLAIILFWSYHGIVFKETWAFLGAFLVFLIVIHEIRHSFSAAVAVSLVKRIEKK